jgi:hypothetical protein
VPVKIEQRASRPPLRPSEAVLVIRRHIGGGIP